VVATEGFGILGLGLGIRSRLESNNLFFFCFFFNKPRSRCGFHRDQQFLILKMWTHADTHGVSISVSLQSYVLNSDSR